jgi:hypothetical protein
MTIFSRILQLLARAGEFRPDGKADRAQCERTEQAIQRYNQMLNASTAQRQGRAHTIGPRDSND